MPSEIKSGNVTLLFTLSASLKKQIKSKAAKQKKSVAQYLRDLAQADLKVKK